MLKKFRQQLIQTLWEAYSAHSFEIKLIESGLKQKNIDHLLLDHFAIIDLPGPNSGIHILKQIFFSMGYEERGKDYLPDRQNDFVWMTEIDANAQIAKNVLPQIVIADFRLEELPLEVKKIIEKYAGLTKLFPIDELSLFLKNMHAHSDLEPMLTLLKNYFRGRDWPLPTLQEYHTVHEFNELLSWVLIFGRVPNHFTLSTHLLNHFTSLDDFLRFIHHELKLELNTDGGIIKGNASSGIAQASTKGTAETIQLADGFITLPSRFVEFVWRYSSKNNPIMWQDYFTGFLAKNADHVIESLI